LNSGRSKWFSISPEGTAESPATRPLARMTVKRIPEIRPIASTRFSTPVRSPAASKGPTSWASRAACPFRSAVRSSQNTRVRSWETNQYPTPSKATRTPPQAGKR